MISIPLSSQFPFLFSRPPANTVQTASFKPYLRSLGPAFPRSRVPKLRSRLALNLLTTQH